MKDNAHSSSPQLSLAKSKIRVLLLESIHKNAIEAMAAAGYSNIRQLPKALEGDALKEAMNGVHLIGIRSRTQVTAEVLKAADRLMRLDVSALARTRLISMRPGVGEFESLGLPPTTCKPWSCPACLLAERR